MKVHVTIPQLGGMYEGDRARKEMLVAHGFRLPSCLDNRPLKFPELEKILKQRCLYFCHPPADRPRMNVGTVVIIWCRHKLSVRQGLSTLPSSRAGRTKAQVHDLIKRIAGSGQLKH